MSIDAGLTIRVEPRDSNWPLFVLDELLALGWRMDDQGSLVILPLGDDDGFEWTEHPPEAGDVRDVFRAKLRAGEPLGVILTWQGSQVGGSITIWALGRIVFTPLVNRRCLPNSSTTDVSWYLPKLLDAVADTSLRFSSWNWAEAG